MTPISTFYNLVIVIFTYIIASDIAFIAIRRFLKASHDLSGVHLFFLSRGLGPAIISVLQYVLFLFFPHRQPYFYVLCIAVIFGILSFYGRKESTELKTVYSTSLRGIARAVLPHAATFKFFVIVFMSFCILILGIAYPIVEHDSLAATIESKIMIREMNMQNYMNVTEADEKTGYYARGFRTPFLHMLYVWFSCLGGSEEMDILARTVSPIYGLHCLLLLGYVVFRTRSSRDALWAIFLLVTTPIFFYNSYSNGIDPPRIYLTFLAVLWLAELIEHERNPFRLAIVTGAVSGFALYSHLLSAPAIFAGVLGLITLRRGMKLGRELRIAVLFLATAYFAGAQYHYLMSPSVLRQLERNFSSDFAREWSELVSFRSDKDENPTIESEAKAEPEPAPKVAHETPAVDALDGSGVENNPDRSLPALAPTDEELASRTTSTGIEPTSIDQPSARRSDAVTTYNTPILETRGHGGTPLSRLIFGRLQMFSGIEYFGFVFYIILISIIIWFRNSRKTTLEKLLLITISIYCVIVLSGVRKLSWSNPRYIGSVVIFGAYFAAPLLVSAYDRIYNKTHSLKKLSFAVLTFCLILPVLLATTVRGAKIEITNRGNFYSDFRSLRWVDHALRNPSGSLQTFWSDYMGIRRTIQYISADDSTKLFHAHDYFAGIQYLNSSSNIDSCTLVFRDARFFYYSDRRGYVWFHPDIMRGYRRSKTDEELHEFLASKGISYILIDDYSTTQAGYLVSKIDDLLANRDLTELVYEYGSVRVYRLCESANGRATKEDQ